MNGVEQSPPTEAGQEISHILMKPEVHYRIHNNQPLFLALWCRAFEFSSGMYVRVLLRCVVLCLLFGVV